MIQNKNEIIARAIAGGAIGGALGAMLTHKKEDSEVAVLLGAAIGISVIAFLEAAKLDVPVLYEENGAIYRKYVTGRIEKVKDLPKVTAQIPSTFSIE